MKRTSYTVTGASPFPIDMLRQDGSWPFQSSDSEAIEYSITRIDMGQDPEPIVVRLESDRNAVVRPHLWVRHGWQVTRLAVS